MAGPALRASTVPLVKAAATAAVRTALAAAFPGPLPVVTYGFPGEGNYKPEMVFFAGATMSNDWSELGRGARDERYDLDFYVNVQHAGAGLQEVTERAYAIYQVCDTAVTDHPSILALPGHCNLIPVRLTERFTADGREAQIAAVLRCYARI